MKKGSVGPVVALVLGLIVIFLILFTFGKPLYEYTSSLFSGGGLLGGQDKEVEDVVIPGTQVKAGDWAAIRMEGSKVNVLNGLADLLLDCWRTMQKTGNRPQKCFKVDLCPVTEKGYSCSPSQQGSSGSDTGVLNVFYDSEGRPVQMGGSSGPAVSYDAIITKQELIAKVRGRDASDAADALAANWARGNSFIRGTNVQEVAEIIGGQVYLICAFDSWPPASDGLYFASDPNFACN